MSLESVYWESDASRGPSEGDTDTDDPRSDNGATVPSQEDKEGGSKQIRKANPVNFKVKGM